MIINLRKFYKLLFAFVLIAFFGCSSKKVNEIPARKTEDWIRKSNIYEVNLRSFQTKQAFKQLEAQLLEIKNYGFNIISLVPIHTIGELNRKGVKGSLYAVKDFFSINPEFGSIEDFKSLVKTVRRLELKIIINFVTDYVAWDNQILLEHPDWLIHNEEGAIVSPSAELYDVAQINLSQHEPKKYIISAMKFWVSVMDIDGFCCIASEKVPLEFWNNARQEIERIKPVVMISKTVTPKQFLKAFDVGYFWSTSELVKNIVEDGKTTSVVQDLLQYEKSNFPNGSLFLRTAMHYDLNQQLQSNVILQVRFLSKILSFSLPGIPLVYQEESVLINENIFKDLRKEQIYNVLHLRNESVALQTGEFHNLTNSENEKVLSFLRASNLDTVLVVINFSNTKKKVSINLTNLPIQFWKDKFSMTTYHTKDSLLRVEIKPLDYLFIISYMDGDKK